MSTGSTVSVGGSLIGRCPDLVVATSKLLFPIVKLGSIAGVRRNPVGRSTGYCIDSGTWKLLVNHPLELDGIVNGCAMVSLHDKVKNVDTPGDVRKERNLSVLALDERTAKCSCGEAAMLIAICTSHGSVYLRKLLILSRPWLLLQELLKNYLNASKIGSAAGWERDHRG